MVRLRNASARGNSSSHTAGHLENRQSICKAARVLFKGEDHHKLYEMRLIKIYVRALNSKLNSGERKLVLVKRLQGRLLCVCGTFQ